MCAYAAAESAATITQERERLRALAARVSGLPRMRATGKVAEVSGHTVLAEGPAARVGEICHIRPTDSAPEIAAQVVGFRHGYTLLLPLGRMGGVAPGCPVTATGRALSVPIGRGILGRVLDAFGRPIDGKGDLGETVLRPVESAPPPPLGRQCIVEPLHFGVRAVDTLLTCGKGQRLGIFSGAGVGKSSLLGMMARYHTADVAVVGLVGERGREVRDFLEVNLGEGLARSVVVAATSDEPALVRIAAGLTATTIAEHFRDQGLDVLLIVDSLTRLARAQREVGLAAGEAPTTRGYPASMYEFLARLLERAGSGATGSITGVYAVLVEGDDLQEPVADAVSAILDGHIHLTRELADRGHYPAVDVSGSVSRLMSRLVDEPHTQAAAAFRELLAAHREVEDLIAVGAYRPGARPLADLAVRRRPDMMQFLRQGQHEYADPSDARRRLLALMGPAGDGERQVAHA
ncbi:FliI/YscN family ATPase [bacterium]|nr:FliI/YscN family ATPase [bacterium]